MNNPFKNNSLASALLGFIIGVGSMAGFIMIYNSDSININNAPAANTSNISGLMSQPNDVSNGDRRMDNTPPSNVSFHGLTDNPDGDVVITPSGTKYHSPYGCRHVRNSYITVRREDAESIGFSSCSICNP